MNEDERQRARKAIYKAYETNSVHGLSNTTVDDVIDALAEEGFRLPPSSAPKPRRRQRIAVLGATYEDARSVAEYLPPEASVHLLSAHRPEGGHGYRADALLITPAAFEVEYTRVERMLPSLKPMIATRQRPEATA